MSSIDKKNPFPSDTMDTRILYGGMEMFKAEFILPKNKRFNKMLDLDGSYF